MRAEVVGYLDGLAVAKAATLSRRPVVPDKAVVKGRLAVVSKVAQTLGKVGAEMVPVGRAKAEVDPCKVVR